MVAYVIPNYNIAVCCYDKIFVYVPAYLIIYYTKLHTINATCKLPEDINAKTYRSNFNINLRYIFVHMLVYKNIYKSAFLNF